MTEDEKTSITHLVSIPRQSAFETEELVELRRDLFEKPYAYEVKNIFALMLIDEILTARGET